MPNSFVPDTEQINVLMSTNMVDQLIPPVHDLMWPVLTALKELGGSATNKEIYEKVIENEHFSVEQQSLPDKSGRKTEIEYRLGWARTHLADISALENSARGIWSLTEIGKSLTFDQMETNFREFRTSRQRNTHLSINDSDTFEETIGESSETWKDQLIARLLEVDPSGFERLAQRLLREAGFVNVTVLGKSGDGGIDGVGVYRLSLVSFPVFFQCKRYRGTVPAGAVRDFRGAMSGRGEKGLLITTGYFTRDAQNEASRDGAPPVELIDGDRLCDLLRDFRLGVSVTERVVMDISVDVSFFEEYGAPKRSDSFFS